MEVIPAGLKPFWHVIKAELEWFDAREEKDVLLDLLKHIVTDNPKKFHALEPKFEQILHVDYKTFSSKGRSVLGWLIAFGAADILSSTDFSTYQINEIIIEQSFQYLAVSHNHAHIARMISLFPFLVRPDKNIFVYVSAKSNLSRAANLASIFANLKTPGSVHIRALMPLLNRGSEIHDLVILSVQIIQEIRSLNPINHPVNRDLAVKNYKLALQTFFSHSIQDYRHVGRVDRFSIAKLFIQHDNAVALNKLLLSAFQGSEIFSLTGNGKSLLRWSIDENATECFKAIARLNPMILCVPENGLQAPIFQAIFYGSERCLRASLECLPNNPKITVYGADIRFSAAGLAILYGKVDLLDIIVKHFDGINLRDELEIVMNYMESEYSKEVRAGSIRREALIPHQIWMYLLNSPGICTDVINNRSLLDLAVIDRNPEAVRIIVSKLGFDVNTNVRNGPLMGTCLRFVKGDIPTLKILYEMGLDVNVPVLRLLPNMQYEEIPSLAYLMSFVDDAFQEFLATIQFS